MSPENLRYLTLSDGQKIAYYDRAGSRGTIVLIHGNSGSAGVFNSVFENGNISQRLIAIDLPGCGHSFRSADLRFRGSERETR